MIKSCATKNVPETPTLHIDGEAVAQLNQINVHKNIQRNLVLQTHFFRLTYIFISFEILLFTLCNFNLKMLKFKVVKKS